MKYQSIVDIELSSYVNEGDSLHEQEDADFEEQEGMKTVRRVQYLASISFFLPFFANIVFYWPSSLFTLLETFSLFLSIKTLKTAHFFSLTTMVFFTCHFMLNVYIILKSEIHYFLLPLAAQTILIPCMLVTSLSVMNVSMEEWAVASYWTAGVQVFCRIKEVVSCGLYTNEKTSLLETQNVSYSSIESSTDVMTSHTQEIYDRQLKVSKFGARVQCIAFLQCIWTILFSTLAFPSIAWILTIPDAVTAVIGILAVSRQQPVLNFCFMLLNVVVFLKNMMMIWLLTSGLPKNETQDSNLNDDWTINLQMTCLVIQQLVLIPIVTWQSVAWSIQMEKLSVLEEEEEWMNQDIIIQVPNKTLKRALAQDADKKVLISNTATVSNPLPLKKHKSSNYIAPTVPSTTVPSRTMPTADVALTVASTSTLFPLNMKMDPEMNNPAFPHASAHPSAHHRQKWMLAAQMERIVLSNLLRESPVSP